MNVSDTSPSQLGYESFIGPHEYALVRSFRTGIRWAHVYFVAALLIIACSLPAHAQRRKGKVTPTPTPVPTATATPLPTPSAETVAALESIVAKEEGIDAQEEDEGFFDTSKDEQTFASAINENWKQVIVSIKGGNLRQVQEGTEALIQHRNEMNFQSLDEYSLFLLHWARTLVSRKKTETAAFYVKRALALSPTSPLVARAALPLLWATRAAPISSHLSQMVHGLGYSTEVILELAEALAYPLLWAATGGLYFCFVFLLMGGMGHYLGAIARFFPTMFRGFLGPVVGGVLLLIPLLGPPLLCLGLWSILALFVIPRRNGLAFLTGVLIAAWALIIPLKENLSVWMEDDGVRAMLRVLSGSFRSNDVGRLKNLYSRLPENPIAAYAHAQLLIREGLYPLAEEALNAAEAKLGRQPYTVAERGIIAFMLGKNEEASKLHEEAAELGIDSAEFYFNFSKVRFAELEVVRASALLAKARDKNAQATDLLVEREKIHGNNAIAAVPLPAFLVITRGWFEDGAARTTALQRLALLFPVVPPFMLAISGAVLAVLGLAKLAGGSHSPRSSDLYSNYKVLEIVRLPVLFIPGGGLALDGKALRSFVLLFTVFLSLFPCFGWPQETAGLFNWFPDLKLYYLGVLAVLWLGNCYLTLGRSEGTI